MSIADDIRSFIVDELMDGQAMEADPLAEGKLDSLAIEQVIGFIEERYDVMFEDDELVAENFADLGAVAAFVEKKIAAKTLAAPTPET